MSKKISKKVIKDSFDYNPETGEITWKKKNKNQHKAGSLAGTITPLGYRRICLYGKRYMAHHIAWIFITGKWPTGEIDHINGVKDDNRICNLRVTDRSSNMRNYIRNKSNTSGVTGVSRDKHYNKWVAQIGFKNKRINLGYFSNFEDAVFARWSSEKKHNFINYNTTSTAYLYLKENNLVS